MEGRYVKKGYAFILSWKHKNNIKEKQNGEGGYEKKNMSLSFLGGIKII